MVLFKIFLTEVKSGDIRTGIPFFSAFTFDKHRFLSIM